LKKPPEKISRVGLIANSAKPGVAAVVREAERHLRRFRLEVHVDTATAGFASLKHNVHSTPAGLAHAVDLLVVIGGDGTMLRAVREIQGAATPILGINVGRLGFLTAVPSKNLAEALRLVARGEYFFETRQLIEAATPGPRLHALNDFVISRGAASRMIELEVSVNGEFLTNYRSDGLIVSSPTGSTAYSLSAGGAIVSPAAAVIALTPICPHTVSNRSLILSLDSVINVRVISGKLEVNVTADGQVQHDLAANEIVRIRKSRRSVRLMHLKGSSFFETLRRKLHWSGSNV
jgi:NAD+ kinase